jgi:glycogen debranching enzyme
MLNRRSLLRLCLSWPLAGPMLSPATLLAGDEKQRFQETLTKTRPTNVESLAHAIVMKKDNLFFLADPSGDVPMTDNHGLGLYYHDCRYLNGYELTLDGLAPVGLSASAAVGAVGVFSLTNRELVLSSGDTIAKEELGLTWHRVLASETPALVDELRFENFSLKPVKFSVTLAFRSAFEDLYVVRGLAKPPRGDLDRPRWNGDVLRLAYHGYDGITRAVSISSDPAPDERSEASTTFHLALDPGQRQTIGVSLALDESKGPGHARPGSRRAEIVHSTADINRQKDLTVEITKISGNGSALDQLMDRSFRGLEVLRTHLEGDEYFAAGVPWFVTLFGRDSLITALQMLPYHSGIAEQTLRLLAQYQGRGQDDERDEQPGKILHELRIGELANLNAIPQTPSYSTVDATPLFLILLAQHARWTGSLRVFQDLRPCVDLALEWIDVTLSRYPRGYLAYESKTGTRMKMANKGWKDSGNAIMNKDGTSAKPPIALVEVQGYVYAAWRGIASLLERNGETAQGEQLRRQAEQLKERFNRDYWMDEEGCYALALQQDGIPAAVVSSNPGQALWTGIATEAYARRTIDRLMAADMFSGWGVRTLSAKERAFNPIGYHLGTVWPHDNAISAAGFRRYGGDDEALRIFHGLFDAAFHFHLHQLPELFCGFDREDYEIPINYPVACHPQAWAAGALPFLLVTLLGLEPDAFGRRLEIVRPMLPRGLDRLHVTRLRVGEASVDLTFRRTKEGVEVEVGKLDGRLELDMRRT